MKKLIYSTFILLLTLSFQTAHAGVIEDKVIQLLSSSSLNDKVSSTAQFTIDIDGKETVVEKGKTTKNSKFKVNLKTKLVLDATKNAFMLEGSFVMSDTSDSAMNITLPFKMIAIGNANGLELDSLYFYVYSEYINLAKSVLGINNLDTYASVWLRFSGTDIAGFSEASQSSSASSNVLSRDTSWFKASVKKVNGQDVYTLTIKGDVLLKKINAEMKANGKRLTASVLKSNRELVDLLKKGKIQIVAQDGNLAAFSGIFTVTDTVTNQVYGKNNKKVPRTTTTNAKIAVKGTVLPIETVTVPQARDINIKDFMTELIGQQTQSAAATSNLSDSDQAIANKVSKLITLSTPENPEFFTITDIYTVKGTAFGKNKALQYAQNGDFILIYEKNNKIFIWRPTLNAIVGEGTIY